MTQPPDVKSFVDRVIAILLTKGDPTLEEVELDKKLIAQLYSEGWEFADVVAYCKCLEHRNPTLDEDIALTRMDQLREKYSTVKGPRNVR